jgi:hypothetical protein
MDDLAIARAIHVLALIHWIGGVSLVTLVLLPAVTRVAEPDRRLQLFEAIEQRFSFQAKFSVTLAGASGFYMIWRYDIWDRFADPAFWWMHAMALLWLLFTLILFVGEPLFLHAWFHARVNRDPMGTFALVLRLHRVLLALAAITVLGAVVGVHGG